jgi:hypothetical protein
MTKKDEVRDGVTEIVGTTILNSVVHVWFVKRAIYHLTGRDPGWRGAYSVLAAIQAAGYWASAGDQSRRDFWDKINKLKNDLTVEKSRARS